MFIQLRYESNDFPSNNTIYLIFTIIINFYKFRYKIKKKKKSSVFISTFASQYITRTSFELISRFSNWITYRVM